MSSVNKQQQYIKTHFQRHSPSTPTPSTQSKSSSGGSYGKESVTPLIMVRRRLFRPIASKQKPFFQGMQKTHNIENLFKLYYSNDTYIDNFNRQIVTGTRMPTHIAPSARISSGVSSTSDGVYSSKHCVSKEFQSTSDMDYSYVAEKDENVKNEDLDAATNSEKQNLQIQCQTSSPITQTNPISRRTLEVRIATEHSNLQSSLGKLSDMIETNKDETIIHDDIKEKSLQSFDSNHCDIPNNNLTRKLNNNNSAKSASSFVDYRVSLRKSSLPSTATTDDTQTSVQSKKTSSIDNKTINSEKLLKNRTENKLSSHISTKTPALLSNQQLAVCDKLNPNVTVSRVSFTTFSSARSALRHGKDIIPLQHRVKSTICSNNSKSRSRPATKTEFFDPAQTIINAQRTVSIPSRCSQYVLVTFPEMPGRYMIPTYVERLLLPQRFPNLFKNIANNFDHELLLNNQYRLSTRS
ncbi:unnamed protein product [Didymodactylos carnosus]|uniref:Uncharacterized protein n=1 Tax=Didymodactylos carnosus TaxID=1234261 RepID=A0A8S2GU09_9BILA|nr:unnamed protein product [Didymodactylos carnosus]CAF3539555.1 unnamed protein product [Didymodactylos carnosus]